MKLNLDLSREVGQRVNAQDKDCFFNSVMGLAYLSDDEARYVEGFCIAADFPIIVHHGWIEAGGEIIDPTPTYHSGRTERTYFPVDRYSLTDVRKRINKRSKVTLPFTDIWEREQRWRDVFEKAEEFMYEPDVLAFIRGNRGQLANKS